jgi:hypothetical protein
MQPIADDIASAKSLIDGAAWSNLIDKVGNRRKKFEDDTSGEFYILIFFAVVMQFFFPPGETFAELVLSKTGYDVRSWIYNLLAPFILPYIIVQVLSALKSAFFDEPRRFRLKTETTLELMRLQVPSFR